MARSNLTVVVKVHDLATKKLKEIEEALKSLGGVATDIASKFKSFSQVTPGAGKGTQGGGGIRRDRLGGKEDYDRNQARIK